jgi:uncharacterized protein YbaR (Trm112 family)
MDDFSKLEVTCPKCKGNKFIENLEWQEYNNKEMELIKKYENQGFEPYMYWPLVDKEMKELGYFEPEGPEEYPCPECEGRGTVLTEEGKQLISFIRKYI